MRTMTIVCHGRGRWWPRRRLAQGSSPGRPAGTLRRNATPAKPPRGPRPTPENPRSGGGAGAPPHEPTYDEGTAQRIREAAPELFRYRGTRADGRAIPAGGQIRIGACRERPSMTICCAGGSSCSGDPRRPTRRSGAYDDALADAVKRFPAAPRPRRHRHLERRGRWPRSNRPNVHKRIRQLDGPRSNASPNMNFPVRPSATWVVNLPANVSPRRSKTTRRCGGYRVIVGKTEKSPSPDAEPAQITSVNLNPDLGRCRPSIAKSEIFGRICARIRGYLSRIATWKVLDAHDGPIDPHAVDWFRQTTRRISPCAKQSGSWNALGALEDRHAELLFGPTMHDTNQRKSVSTNDYRFDSHGCFAGSTMWRDSRPPGC